jgi:hypothetical protein
MSNEYVKCLIAVERVEAVDHLYVWVYWTDCDCPFSPLFLLLLLLLADSRFLLPLFL